MTTPRLQLSDGEEVLETHPALRRKGIFGNRFGELHLTNQRVAFVKSIMRSGAGGVAAGELVARPMIAFDRGSVSRVEKSQARQQIFLSVTADGVTERFAMAEGAVDSLVGALSSAGR